MEIIYILAGVVFLFIILPALLGLFIPKDHSCTRSAWYNAEPETIWALLSEFASQKAWRSDLKKIEKLADYNGAEAWKETSRNGQSLQLAITGKEPVQQFVRTIINNKAFGGEWVTKLIPETQGTRVEITENGYINNPGMRFIFRFFFNSTSSIDKYLQMLGTHLGQKVELK